jgi:hypothetical protein
MSTRRKYETALASLRQYTGNDKAGFRDGQWDAIDALANGERVAVIERTGWGRSAVYLIAAKLLRDAGGGPALLVSPLLSLIRDQINAAGRHLLQPLDPDPDHRPAALLLPFVVLFDTIMRLVTVTSRNTQRLPKGTGFELDFKD